MDKQRLYKKDVYRTNCESILQNVKENKNVWYFSFNQSVFAPEGGGQSGDRGTVVFSEGPMAGQSIPVIDSQEEGDIVWHLVEKSALPEPPAPGTMATLQIDFDHRFDNMQRHAGEHILSGVLYRRFGAVNKGFHMGEEGMEIDMDFSHSETITGTKYERITWEMAKEAEREANAVIWRNEPITTEYFATREEAGKRPLRKALTLEKEISIVTIGDYDHPDDCVACCGTHPARTGEIGLLRILRIEPNKGMSRILVECGKRALAITRNEADRLYDLEVALSAGPEDVLEKFHAQAKKARETYGKLRALQQRAESEEAMRIRNQECAQTVFRYDATWDVESLQRIGKQLIGELPDMVFLAHEPSNTVLVYSNGEPAVGAFLKQTLGAFGGRGGGGKTNGRAMFPSEAQCEAFLKKVQKNKVDGGCE